MTGEDWNIWLKSLLHKIGTASLVFSLVIAVILLINYRNLKRYSPLESERAVSLLERIDADPQNTDLREAYRSLDLVSRKAYFVSIRQIDSGKILLIIGLVVFFFSRQISLLLDHPRFSVGKADKKSSTHSLTIKHLSVLGLVLVMLIPALILSSLNSRLIRGEASSALGSGTAGEAAADGLVSSEEAAAVKELISPEEDSEGNWNHFRNEGRPWVSSHAYPLSWNADTGENIRWEQEIELPGFGSPVLWEDHLYLTGGDESEFRIECRSLDTGEILWQYNIPVEDPAQLPLVQSDTGYAASTPSASSTGIFAVFATGEIFALDHQGNLLWKRALGVPDNHYGHSSSLLTYDGMLFVQYDTNVEHYVLALDETTGEDLWKTERTGDISWSSPILVMWEDQVYLLLNTSPFVSAYDPFTGNLLWETECLFGEIAPSLAFSEGIISAAQAYSCVCSLDIQTGELLWEGNGALPDVSSPVSSGGILYLPSTYGTVTALNLSDSSEYWYFEQYDAFYSSPVLVNDRLYISDLAGLTTIFAAAEEMEILGEGFFPEPVYATPVFTEKGIVYRTLSRLYLVDGAVE